jgi:hypothetical protein
MKFSRPNFQRRICSRESVHTIVSLLGVIALAAGLWLATTPAARGREMTPAEMIQQGLPPGKTMKTATKAEFLSAVCAAVRHHRNLAAEITKVAISAHREYAADIVGTVLRCSPSVDCEFVGVIVEVAVRTAPDEASVIDDAALALAPDCADAIQDATQRALGDIPGEGPGGGGPSTQVPLPGGVGGGGGGPAATEPVLVCDNGTQRHITSGSLGSFLTGHPGSFVGSCQPTPTTNR